MTLPQLLSRVALAFGIGLLIGLERGWHSREVRSGGRTAGVRTFAISGLLGGIVAALARGDADSLGIGGAVLLGSTFLTYAAVVASFARDENRAMNKFSATTTVAALLTFMLGAYSILGDVRVAGACGVATAGILVIRETLHEWVAKLTLAELESGLVLLAMTFIALPIMPDRSIGPFGGVNPRVIWIIAIVLATVSFAGYVAVQLLGERRGILVAAACGGLVSSTAVTLANAKRADAGEGGPHLLAAAAALATAISLARVLGIIVVLQPPLIATVAPMLLAGSGVTAALSIGIIRLRGSDERAPVVLRNPFRLISVIGMAAVIAVLVLAGRMVHAHFGALGSIAGAATMGLADVDAMTVSITSLVPGSLSNEAAAYAILAGVAANSLTKVVLGFLFARGWFAWDLAAVSALGIASSWLALIATLAIATPELR